MNSKEEKINSVNIDKENKAPEESKIVENLVAVEDEYKFGWSNYSEKTNGRFAMIGFLAIILIELLCKQSFLEWAGIL